MAPEVVNNREVTNKADIWSLGVIMYVLCTGGIIDNASDQVIFDFNEQVWESYSDDIRIFIEECLWEEPERRASVKDLTQLDFM